MRTLCIHAAAMVRALFATSCHCISQKFASCWVKILVSFFWGTANLVASQDESNTQITSSNDEMLYRLILGMYSSSGMFSSGTKKFLRPF